MPERRVAASELRPVLQESTVDSREPEAPPAGAAGIPSGDPPVSLELVRAAINALPDAIIVTDTQGRLLLFNSAADRILPLGMVEEPIVEWSAYGGFLEPDMRTPFSPDALPPLRALSGEVDDDCEIYLPGTRGPEGRWISFTSRPVVDSHRRIVGGVTAVRDITERKRQLERHHLLANIVEETADAVLVTDSGGNIVYVNSAFERTSGFSRTEVLGENPRLLQSGMHSRNFYEDLWGRLLRGEVYRGTLIDRRKNGKVYLSSQTITPLRTPDGAISHMVSIARDLTDRHNDSPSHEDAELVRSVARQLSPSAQEAPDGSEA
jgi:PAS domain S-box-containing protein